MANGVGAITIPNIRLDGRQSKIIVTDYSIGKNTLLYSSAEVLTYADLDKDVVVFYLNVGQEGVFTSKTHHRIWTSRRMAPPNSVALSPALHTPKPKASRWCTSPMVS